MRRLDLLHDHFVARVECPVSRVGAELPEHGAEIVKSGVIGSGGSRTSVIEARSRGSAVFPALPSAGRARSAVEGSFEEGRRQGAQEGERRGELRGKRHALLRLLERRGITLSAEDRARIDACVHLPDLDRWLDEAVSAGAVADRFSGTTPAR